jgi:hypothetical protein
MCVLSTPVRDHKAHIDAQAEAEGTALDWFIEEVGLPELLTAVQKKALEHIAHTLRVIAAEAGEWRLDDLPKQYRYQRRRMVERVLHDAPPSRKVTTTAEREAHTAKLNELRAARVAAIRQLGGAILTTKEAGAASGFHPVSLQQAAKAGRLRALKGKKGAYRVRAVDLADYVSRCHWSNLGRNAQPRERSAAAIG